MPGGGQGFSPMVGGVVEGAAPDAIKDGSGPQTV